MKIRNAIDKSNESYINRQIGYAEHAVPIIKNQNVIKTSQYELQNQMIDTLDKNQKNLIESASALSDTMSRQGSVSGLEQWLDSQKTCNPIIEDNEEDKEDDYVFCYRPEFNIVEKAVLNQYKIDPSFNTIPSKQIISYATKSTNATATLTLDEAKTFAEQFQKNYNKV